MSQIQRDYNMVNFVCTNARGYAPSQELKKNVWMTFQHTAEIAHIVTEEPWGAQNKRLHSYLDYTFRCRVQDKQAKAYHLFNGKSIGLFNTGLKFKDTSETMFCVFKPTAGNTNKKQQWTFPQSQNTYQYCMTRLDIIKTYGINSQDIPNDFIYLRVEYTPKWKVNLHWNQILKRVLNQRKGGSTRKIILDELKKNGVLMDKTCMRQKLVKPMSDATEKAINLHHTQGQQILPCVYFEKGQYNMYLQLLLDLNVEETGIQFVVVLRQNFFTKTYEFTKLVNLEMGIKNARLVGPLTNVWLALESDGVTTMDSDSQYNSVSDNDSFETKSQESSSSDRSSLISVFGLPFKSKYPEFYSVKTHKTVSRIKSFWNSTDSIVETITKTRINTTAPNELPIVESSTKSYNNNEEYEFKNVMQFTDFIEVISIQNICNVSQEMSIDTVSQTTNINFKEYRAPMKSFISTMNKYGEFTRREIPAIQK